MIYHLVNDEKVINRTIDIFETVFPGENIFVVFREPLFLHVKNGRQVVSYTSYCKNQNLSDATSVIIHLMTNRKIKFINEHIDSKVTVYWVMWGSDLYDRLLMPKGYELVDTKSEYYRSNKVEHFFRSLVKEPSDQVRILRRMHFIEKRVKYLVTSTVEDDYKIITDYYPALKNKLCREFSYYPIDMVVGEEMAGLKVNNTNIQIGNSGTLSNNHEYVFRILSTLEIKNRDIIVPLSYSAKRRYKKTIIKKGHELFKDHLKPVTRFMPLADYTNMMAGCNVAIYGNWRQEAVGNIMVSLYLGAKVFISKRNPILFWASKHGFIVCELESITQEALDVPLDQASQEHNRNLLLQHYDTSTLYKSMMHIFEER